MTTPLLPAWINGAALETAIENERPVRITYVARDGEETVRTIEPYAIAATANGNVIVRAMDRRSGDYRSFRLDRIIHLKVAPGGFLLSRPGAETAEVIPEILVRYTGSVGRFHGEVMRLLGICGCERCADLGIRYRVAEVDSHVCQVWCVRGRSFTVLGEAEVASYRAETEAAHRAAALDLMPVEADAAIARILAEIDEIDPCGYYGDAARWSPDEPNA